MQVAQRNLQERPAELRVAFDELRPIPFLDPALAEKLPKHAVTVESDMAKADETFEVVQELEIQARAPQPKMYPQRRTYRILKL